MKKTNVNRKFIKGKKKTLKKQRYDLDGGAPIKFDIKIDRILGHSDIAPSRKLDPGEKFNWHKLAKINLSIWPEKILNIPKSMASDELLYNLLQ